MQAAACFWFVIVYAFAGNAQVGQPFVANFPPSDYHSSSYTSSPNNYCVIQDRLGTIYLANGNVSLFYKGKRWMPISGTEEKEFSKMAVGKNGRIFTGGVHDLGWFEPDSLGGLAFVSLIEKVSPEALDFEKIFNVTSDKKGNVFFLDKKWLFRWDGDSLQCWKSKHAFRKSLDVNGMVYVQSKDDGLWTFENGFAEKMVGSESLDSLSLRGIHMARNSKDKRFFFTYNQGLFVADGNGLKKLASPLDSFLIWNTVQVTDRLIALATSSHGLVLFDLVSREHARINEKQGLFTNSTVFPNLDAEGGIWLAALLGTSRVTHPFSLQKITSDGNPRLLVLLMLRFEEKLFIGTVNGCWVFQKGKGKEKYGLSKLSGMADIVSALVSFGDELLIGSPTDGVVRIKDDRQTKISEYGATAFCRSVVEPNRLYLGTEEGLFSLLHKGEQWLDEGQVKGVDHAIHHIAELPNGDLWASFTEVSRIQFKNGIVSDTIVTHFDSTQGFTQDHTEFEMLVHEGKLIFGTNRGIFQFDDKQQKLLPARQFGERFSDKGLAARPLVQDLLGQIWLYDGTRTGFLRRDQNGQWQWNDLPLRRMEDQEVWCIYPSPDSLIWIGTTTTLYCYDPRIPKDYHVPYHTLIDRVTVNDTQVVFYGNYADAGGLLTDIQPDNYKLTFPYERNNIAFSYTATSYEYPEKTVFSHWLKGLEDDWSPWGPESDKAYNDLPEGTYTFHARSKNLYDTLGKEAAYTFTILPPWYRTWWAYVLYACAAIGMVVLIVRWQVGRANRKQEAARELERQQQRAILQTTVETQESERIRIARDLHDEVGALLSTVKMSLKLSQRKLAKDGVETSLDESTEMLDSAIGSVRQISHDLLPPSLESLGICAALAQLATKTAQLSGIPFECVLIHEPPRLEIRTELTLYRVVQELISNSLKHSQATERRLDFSFRDSVFTLVFRDNGIGFDLAKVKESGAGLGLRGMESRVDALGGKLRFETAPGQGFVAEISLRV
jgi:signal transduction histidine kinase